MLYIFLIQLVSPPFALYTVNKRNVASQNTLLRTGSNRQSLVSSDSTQLPGTHAPCLRNKPGFVLKVYSNQWGKGTKPRFAHRILQYHLSLYFDPWIFFSQKLFLIIKNLINNSALFKTSNQGEDYVLCKHMVKRFVSEDWFKIKKKNNSLLFPLSVSFHIHNLAYIYLSQRLCFAKWMKHINPDIYYVFVYEVDKINLLTFFLTVTLIILTPCDFFFFFLPVKCNDNWSILKSSHHIMKITSM